MSEVHEALHWDGWGLLLKVHVGLCYEIDAFIGRDIRVETDHVHRDKECLLWDHCIFNKVDEISGVFDVGILRLCDWL